MIVDAILLTVYVVLQILIAPILLLPDVSVDSGVGNAINQAAQYLGTLDKFIPLDTLLIVIGLVLAVEVILNLYKLVMWVIRRIPTQS